VQFEIVSEIRHVETIASGSGVRDLPRLRKMHGEGRWRKLKGVATVRLPSGRLRLGGDPLVRSSRCREERLQDQALP
jgi:hypothetical protein